MARHPTVHHRLIYRSGLHLWATFAFIAAPLVFLFLFSRAEEIAPGELFSDVAVSIARLAAAYAMAAVAGWILAAFFYRGRRALVALPVFDVLQSFPTFAALPLAVFYWGAGEFTVIFFLFITVLWPILFSLLSSLKFIRRDWEEAVRVAGLKGKDYVRRFLWPASIPGLITGSVIGLGDGWGALVATEIIVKAKTGLGAFFSANAGRADLTAFGVLGFLLIVFSINTLVWTPLMEWSRHLTDE